jgi:hypothetical protein
MLILLSIKREQKVTSWKINSEKLNSKTYLSATEARVMMKMRKKRLKRRKCQEVTMLYLSTLSFI